MKHLIILLITLLPLSAFEIPTNSTQALVGIAPSWNSSTVTLTLYEKSGNKWKPVLKPWTGRLGKKGLAWGRGLSPAYTKPHLKKEGDWRSPAGVYNIASPYGIYGTKTNLQKHPSIPYTQVTTKHLWVEDPKSAYYNQPLILNHEPSTTWEKKAQMRQNDYPHSLKLYIGHNNATKKQKAIPYAGSSIFFHIWRRDGKSPTAGCTTMHETNLRNLISHLDPNKKPIYILLPSQNYKNLRQKWKLP